MSGDCGCDKSQPGVDSRLAAAPGSLAEPGPVLGPYLGGGVVGTGLGAGNIAKVGGGVTLAVHTVTPRNPDLGGPYEAIRHDYHFDFSTPTMIFQRDRFTDPALNRELGGMGGEGTTSW